MSNANKDQEWHAKLRERFDETDISWLPKPTKAQTEEVKRNFRSGARCRICGAWHHPDVQHLPYVGHAAVTNRLLNVDPFWNWEFLCANENGSPVIDENGGLWIKLTINGVTRNGYGDAPGSKGADAMKERIGDAIRNAAMRFGVALELWHKGTLSDAVTSVDADPEDEKTVEIKKNSITDERLAKAIEKIKGGEYTVERLYNDFSLTDEQQDFVADSGVLS